ncbi:Fur-regulated basic protein FbpA [Neobacillus sp. LXY-4]|uniref:Fur-regulated basic protein FbpA n=1 Tax=Neobacillus sp. LXY-4 TaxID=3379826 RepID=UPI003EE18591
MNNKKEKKRQKLINKLIFFNVYKDDDKQLYEMPLFKLESIYKEFQLKYHPHGEFGSIKFI